MRPRGRLEKEMGPMTKLRRLLPRILLESFFIILSVLVALAVNDWMSGRERATRASEARAAFVREIASNRELVASSIYLEHHRQLQAVYQKLMVANAVDSGALYATGLHPPPFRDAAWRSFSTSPVFADFAAEDVLLLSDVYRMQADIDRRNAAFIDMMTAPRSDRESAEYQRDSARAISMFLNDLVPAEERLLKAYDQALEQLRR